MAGKKSSKKRPAKRGKSAAAKRPRTSKTGAAATARPPGAQRAGVSAQPLIAVRDVISSSRFYRTLLDGRGLEPGSDHDEVYDRVYVGDALVLQLHSWDDEEHPNLQAADSTPPGHGVLLWFEVDAFDAAVARLRTLEAEVLEEVHVNEAAQHREIWIRDPDGYVIVLASPDGEVTA